MAGGAGFCTLGFALADSFSLPILDGMPDYVFVLLIAVVAIVAHLRTRSPADLSSFAAQLFAHLREPIFITDDQDRLVDLNPAAAGMLSAEVNVYLGRPIAHALPGVIRPPAVHGEDGDGTTFARTLPDGQVRRYAVHRSPLYDGEQISGFAHVLYDVSSLSAELEQQKQAASEAAEASRLTSEFLAVMSHEVRTPMQAVIAMTGLLLGTELTDEQRDYVESIHSSGDSMLSIVNNVLDFSKIEAGQIELEDEPFDPIAAVEDTLNIFAGQAALKNVELTFGLSNNVPGAVSGDVTRFRQILNNLVGNAVKFTDRGEVSVLVNSQHLGERVLLHVRVRDTGIGIPPDRMDRIFASFSQADASTTRIYGGTGLGLAICKRLCELMDGDIWVENHPGPGTTFNFTVMVSSAADAQPALAQERTLTGRSVLVVDDSAASRDMLSAILGTWGMRVETAESGSAAVQMLEAKKDFDAILIDLHMPVMDGEAAVRQIRALRIRPEPRLVMMLALTDSGIRTKAAELGLASVIAKPLKRSQLRSLLCGLVAAGEPSSTDEAAQQVAPQPEPKKETRVLLADDNRVGQRVTSALLRRLGYKADTVASGKEVLDALQRKRYDVVLMDVYMPELDGLATTRKIREDFDEAHQPYVIALTASAVASDRQECINAGMNDYLSKPLGMGDLREALARALPSDVGSD